jgi:hypothetical protein
VTHHQTALPLIIDPCPDKKADNSGYPTTSRLRALGFTIAPPVVPPSPAQFGREDCEVFARYPQPVLWGDANVSAADQARFRSVRERLGQLAAWLAEHAPVDMSLQGSRVC